MGNWQKGFTIIEVVLVITISGLMAAGIMIGVSSSINRQQYRDSVQSFAAFLRSEYSKVINVENNREKIDGTACSMLGATNASRGQSDCVIVGRYIQTEGDVNNNYGKSYASYAVYARKVGGDWRYARTDGKGVNKNDITKYDMDWSAKSKFSNMANNKANIAILMYRDPDNGNIIIRTNAGRYHEGVGSVGMTDFVKGNTEAGHSGDIQFSGREICVYDDKWMVGERLSVFLNSRSGSSSAITVEPSGDGCNKVGV